MARHNTELFAQFIYSPDLTYDELLEREEAFKLELQAVLEKHGGEFVHFEALGDTLRAQCAFADYEEDLFHAVSDDIVPNTGPDLEGRLLFVHKGLNCLHLYTLSNGRCLEACMDLPSAGSLGKGEE